MPQGLFSRPPRTTGQRDDAQARAADEARWKARTEEAPGLKDDVWRIAQRLANLGLSGEEFIKGFLLGDEQGLLGTGAPPTRLRDYSPRLWGDMAGWATGVPAISKLPRATRLLKSGNPIRAYHGSPHTFDTFDISKIGEGEGAQAFGRGIYVAENPFVAADYRSRLAGRGEMKSFRLGDPQGRGRVLDDTLDYSPRGRKPDLYENIQSGLFEDMLLDENKLFAQPTQTQERVLSRLDEIIEGFKSEWPEGIAPAQELRRDLAKHDAVSLQLGKQPGAFYEVDLRAAPEEFLNLDMPISRQTPQVQASVDEAVKRLGLLEDVNPFIPAPTEASNTFGMQGRTGIMEWSQPLTPDAARLEDLHRRYVEANTALQRSIGDTGFPKPGGDYDAAIAQRNAVLDLLNQEMLREQRAGGRWRVDPLTRGESMIHELGSLRTPERVSNALLDVGIPGAKYWDQMSRNSLAAGITQRQGGPRTRNYVVWDPNRLNIVSRNDIRNFLGNR